MLYWNNVMMDHYIYCLVFVLSMVLVFFKECPKE
jgi:hypothetical protein